jgi:hypothetical protein
MTRILPSSEADWTSGERLFARAVTQYPPRVTLGRLVMEAVKLAVFMFCMGAVVGLIVAVAP